MGAHWREDLPTSDGDGEASLEACTMSGQWLRAQW
jgi:hypothetical protein